jgi:tripartite-type tricarboxylate transporter receptor subunit TctC
MWKTIVAAALICTGASAQAQSVADFYRGKTVDLIIGFATGGSNDAYARALARHMGKHIPGNPLVVARNMPGAGSFQAAAHLYSVASQDGTVLSIAAPTLSLEQKMGAQGVRFDTTQFNWIGRINPLVNMIFVRSDAPVMKVEDVLVRETVLAGTGAGSTVSIFPNAMNRLLGYKFKLVMGYKGTNDAMLAVERNEVEGHNTAWEALKVAHPGWLAEKKIRMLVQFALNRHPDLPDVRTVLELARNEDEKQILAALVTATEVGTSFFTTPKTPPERVEALRRAFDATMADTEFRAELAKMRLGLAPMKGEDLQQLSRDLGALPKGLTERLKSVYGG